MINCSVIDFFYINHLLHLRQISVKTQTGGVFEFIGCLKGKIFKEVNDCTLDLAIFFMVDYIIIPRNIYLTFL